jgi:hypothetical protein
MLCFHPLPNTMSHQQSSDTVTIPDSPLGFWDEQLWIGKNKRYPASETPDYILAARSEVMAIPAAYAVFIPDARLSISDLLRANLPVQSSALITTAARRAFCKDEPNEDLACLAVRHIPPRTWLQQLEAAFGQAWFDGARSIRDERFKSSRLPLWVVSFWKGMADALEKRSAWQAAAEWVDRWGKEKELLHEADCVRAMMTLLSWGVKVSALGADFPKEQFTRLLSDNWIDGEIIDMMMFELSARAKLDPELSKTTMVATLNLSMNINRAFDTGNYTKKAEPLLARYTGVFKRKERTRLHLPAHVNANHWVPYLIDFDKGTLRYGERSLF